MPKKRVSKNLRKLFKKSRKLSYKSRKVSNKSKKPKKVKRKVNPKVGAISNQSIVNRIVATFGQVAVNENAVWTNVNQTKRTNVILGPRGFDVNDGNVYCKQWGKSHAMKTFLISNFTDNWAYSA